MARSEFTSDKRKLSALKLQAAAAIAAFLTKIRQIRIEFTFRHPLFG
ncbi:hypothetical protein EN925_34925 [Mesorhizobium sp. M7A.F.Ca.US.006.04.2.1]|nr:hypothetical protein EOC84_30465 [Mesorhizobium sp. Primo-B]RUU34847.1 hypothetical protein EOC83_27470 [Mesorhizobium sp. Primo-A]RUX70497.1 hypothetical protein EN990_31580 [Mesorhizobium sp. M7A.F.Ca.US.005.03.1.1]RUY14836.1 hypothetical protein EN991_16925 [Mesorhizobium sp. M7A.F.Ca.US.005.03.2.1]RUY27052.1 hypothetical protein EN979_17700 [Mesorhizobium sp. M7A.F.Ca.US.001.04.2.1]RUY44037.1 hypothetical protein EN978_07530 [Mesorhizobium sp. M7A.F.Ca.US.001.04.1.1]RUY97076.1 hypothet